MPIGISTSSSLDPALAGTVRVPDAPEEDLSPEAVWPRMLVLDENTEGRLKEFLAHEISLCWQERDTLVDDWIQWQKDYWAKPAQKVKNFPFQRAANIVIPMTAIAVEAIYARILNTIFSTKPFWSVRPRSADWVRLAPEIEKRLQIVAEDPNILDVFGFARESLLEFVKLGTGVAKSGFERTFRKVNIDLPDGSSTSHWISQKEGATLDYVPLANFLLRLHEKDPQSAVWVGEEHHNVTWAQLKRYAISGRMDREAIESIRSWWTQIQSTESNAQEYDRARRTIENAEPTWSELFSFCEIWLSFDVDNDGVDEEIVVDFHHPSRTILSIRYNWYHDLHRPYRLAPFIPVEGRWAGIGVGKQNEQFQALITTIHRQRLDAGTLANMGQLAVKKTSGYGPGEPIFPGKMWFLDDPSSDIKEFHLSDPHHVAQLNNEEAARQYSDKRTGVNEVILGMPQQGTPGTATSDLARLAEGNKKFDMVLRNVRRWYSILGQDVLVNYRQFGVDVWDQLIPTETFDPANSLGTISLIDIRKGGAIELTVTDSITNKDVEQQKWTSLFAILSGHYDKILERAMLLAQMGGDPTMIFMFAEMALRASNAATRRLLETFNVPDIDTFLLDLDLMNNARSEAVGGGAAGDVGGDSSPFGQAGMEQLFAAFGAGGGSTDSSDDFIFGEG